MKRVLRWCLWPNGMKFGSGQELIAKNRTAFVMGDVHFRFIGPAAYGDRVRTTIKLVRIGGATLHWDCKAVQASDGAPITEGRAIRIHAQIQEDGALKALPVPPEIVAALSAPEGLIDLPEAP